MSLAARLAAAEQIYRSAAQLTGEVKQLNHTISAQKEEIKKLQTMIAELTEKLEAQKALKEQYNVMFSAVQSLNRTVSEIKTELVASRAQNTLSDANAQQMESKLNLLHSALSRMESQLEVLPNLQHEIQSQNEQLRNLREALNLLLNLAK